MLCSDEDLTALVWGSVLETQLNPANSKLVVSPAKQRVHISFREGLSSFAVDQLNRATQGQCD
jgi:hypothetical protein